MKHIQLYESYTEEQVRKVLSKDDIKINVPVDEIINRLNYKQEQIFGFDGFVDSEGKFISEGDKDRMDDYITEFKELGLDTKKVDELFPYFKKYNELVRASYNFDNYEHFSNNGRMLDRIDELEPKAEEFKTEIRLLAKKANQL